MKEFGRYLLKRQEKYQEIAMDLEQPEVLRKFAMDRLKKIEKQLDELLNLTNGVLI